MKKKCSTDQNGNSFCQTTVERVWSKATTLFLRDSNETRQDKYGNVIKFSAYGNRTSEYGWEIDHSKPVKKGGKSHINNLQPLHWRENVAKGDKYPYKKS
jgi:5-methylcytosine-specific restriction endonuclease McrA